jgi:hypothetical protein
MATIISILPLIYGNFFILFYLMYGCHSMDIGFINHCQMCNGMYVKKIKIKFALSFCLHKAIIFYSK